MFKRLLATIAIVLGVLAPSPAWAIHVISPEANIDLNTSKVTVLEGEITFKSVLAFARQVDATYQEPGDRVILINSPGGSVVAGQALIRIMEAEKLRGIKEICVVDTNAHSMAFNFLTHCDVRLAVQGSQMLMHKVAFEAIDCYSTRCTAKQLEEYAKDLEKADEPFRRDNAAALGISLSKYDKLADAQHMWTVQELLKLHYLQGIAVIQK